MYLKISHKHWACDIEGDLIPSTKVYCLAAVNVVTGEEVSLVGPEAVKQWVDERKAEGCKLIYHNGLGYDAPTLNRLLKTTLSTSDIIDTMVMSMLYSPSIQGGHSLRAWGERLKFPKDDFNDFSRFTHEMMRYCLQDARLCRRIYMELCRRMLRVGYSEESIKLEHQSWQLINKQRENGFAFNIEKAHALYAKLREVQNGYEREVHEIWPPTLEHTATFKQAYKKNGEPTQNFKRHCEQFEKIEVQEDGSYFGYEYVSFNIGSPPQRIEKLLELGWRPLANERTKTGLPKPTHKGALVPSLEKFVEESEHKGPQLIVRWMDIYARANGINTWIEAYNEDTGCIHGTLWLANTRRYKHSAPNTANIPAVRLDKDDKPLLGLQGAYTYEARDLWETRDRENRRLVGTDAKGIQLRVLAHYLNNAAFTEAVLGGDPHSYNQEIGGFATRPIAKTFIYAFLLGAGDEKVGQIIGGTPKDGKEIKARFIGNFPGLSQLLNRLEREVNNTGRITLCDGGSLIVTQPHTRLGYLLQGDESCIMKRASVLSTAQIRRRGLDVLKVGDIHDEWQNDTFKDHVDELVQDVFPNAFANAGRSFNYRLPIECDSKVGFTWASTH